jgi:hypothetical protein
MKDDVTVEYETVKYYSGAIGGETPSSTVSGFADPAYYDTSPSPITRPGATNSVFGQTGIMPAVQGSVQDLQALNSGQGGRQNVLGAVQKASTQYNTLYTQNLSQSAQPVLQQNAIDAAQSTLPNATRTVVNSNTGMVFPRATANGGTTGPAITNTLRRNAKPIVNSGLGTGGF